MQLHLDPLSTKGEATRETSHAVAKMTKPVKVNFLCFLTRRHKVEQHIDMLCILDITCLASVAFALIAAGPPMLLENE